MIMCVLLCYPVSIRIYYQQGGLFLVVVFFSVGVQYIDVLALPDYCTDF